MVLKKTKETYNIKGKHYMNDQRNIIVIGGGAARNDRGNRSGKRRLQGKPL